MVCVPIHVGAHILSLKDTTNIVMLTSSLWHYGTSHNGIGEGFRQREE
jgi:hypothetical protein